jgi:ADP-ribosyl-[dinitrogen reductase] hydrolase
VADTTLQRARASFLGLALGDALGATTEFMTPGEIRAKYKVHNKLRGGGWLGVKPGQVTDDTEMSLAIARAIDAAGSWDLQGIAENFLAWMRNKPIDIGSTVRKGIVNFRRSGALEVPPNDWDAGNGALMRLVPAVIYSLGDEALLRRCALEQAHLTHNHPLSDAACLGVGKMVQAALLGADRFALHALARELIGAYPNFRFNDYRGQASGYVVDTLQTVFHYFFSTAGFEECLTGIVNQGGDADTTGAIGGMLAGAFYGLDALPRRWLGKLDKNVQGEIETLVPRLLELSPWSQPQERKPVMDREKISLEVAASRLQSTPLNVLMHIKRGLLVGEEIDGSWWVEVAGLERFLAEKADSPKENLCQSACAHKCPSCG